VLYAAKASFGAALRGKVLWLCMALQAIGYAYPVAFAGHKRGKSGYRDAVLLPYGKLQCSA
jgi:hypothetical protein